MSGNSEPGEQAREEAPGSVGESVESASVNVVNQADAVFADMYNGAIDGDISATLNASSGNSPTHSGPSVVFGVTTKGNGEAFLSEERHTSLGCGGGQAGQGYPCAIVSDDPTVLKRRFSNVEVLDGKVSPTLEAGCGEGGNNVPMIMDEALSFQERAGKPGGGKGILIQHDKVASLRTNQNQAVCMETFHCSSAEECSETLKARDYKDPHVVAYGISSLDSNAMKSANPNSGIYEAESTRTLDNNSNNTVRQGTVVRRLTPGECTALQGFPAGWVDIGDWVDTKGKKHKESDSCKYKALGNSIAIPYWAWMAKRMAMFLPKDATMASLFDGIGGFPLSFSRAGVKPVWASEIEEFPIAVTKIRFPEV